MEQEAILLYTKTILNSILPYYDKHPYCRKQKEMHTSLLSICQAISLFFPIFFGIFEENM